MKTTTAIALVLSAASTATFFGLAAASAPEPLTTETIAKAGEFQIDPVHSCSIFRVHHLKAGMFHGMFDRVTGTIAFDPENPGATTFDVTIDIDSVHTGSEERNQGLTNHLLSADFFAAKEHPTMSFKSTAVKVIDDDMLEVTGDLTIRGATEPITVMMDVTGYHASQRGTAVGFETVFEITRTDFGVSYMADSGMLGTDVKVKVAIEAGMRGE